MSNFIEFWLKANQGKDCAPLIEALLFHFHAEAPTREKARTIINAHQGARS